jgi:hypothetical protein
MPLLTNMFTHQNKIFFVFNDTGVYVDKIRNTGAGGSVWEIRTPWLDGGVGPVYKNIERILFEYLSTSSSDSITVKIYKDHSTTASDTATLTPATSGQTRISKWLKFYVRNAKKFQIGFSGPGGSSSSAAVRITQLLVTGDSDEVLQG